MQQRTIPNPSSHRPSQRLRAAGAIVGTVLLLGGCGAAEVAQQQVEQAVDAVGESAKAEAQRLLGEALGTLPSDQLQVSEQNRAAFEELRKDLEGVNGQVVDLLSAPADLSEAALGSLQDQLAQLGTSVAEQTASLTGISVEEQQAWADLARAVQRTAEQVDSLANLLG